MEYSEYCEDNNTKLEQLRLEILRRYSKQDIKNRKQYLKECVANGETPCDLFTGTPHDLLPERFTIGTYKMWDKILPR